MSDEEKEVTPEESEAHRMRTLEFYKKQNEILEQVLKYETLQAEIQEQKTKAVFFCSQRAAPTPSEDVDKPSKFNTSEGEGKSRKLATK